MNQKQGTRMLPKSLRARFLPLVLMGGYWVPTPVPPDKTLTGDIGEGSGAGDMGFTSPVQEGLLYYCPLLGLTIS